MGLLKSLSQGGELCRDGSLPMATSL
uniref:Uncharacterized protein n=1 Tax=Anguilla anguilla TaxID=7936 RepID=A0A0E9PI50_ANGAN